MLLRQRFGAWNQFTSEEKRDIVIYGLGVVLYRFGLEVFNGSIITLAVDLFFPKHTFATLGGLTAVNQAMQCVGAILIGPWVQRSYVPNVLAATVMSLGLATTFLIIIDDATGGSIKSTENTLPNYGHYPPGIIFPIYMVAGALYGMVELLRRVIRRDILNGDTQKLRIMDALIHVVNESAGIGGAFACTALILRFGNNYSFVLTAPALILAGVLWLFVSSDRKTMRHSFTEDPPPYFKAVVAGSQLFFKSVYKGAKMTFTARKFIWLWACSALPLYTHRFLAVLIAPAIAKLVFGVSAYSQILVGMSNLGVLLGGLFVVLTKLKSPLPWLRLSCFLLPLVWLLPFYESLPQSIRFAWRLAPLFAPVSLGWAAGDFSLTEYMHTVLVSEKSPDEVSVLGAITSFLHGSYIILYAVLSPSLGSYIDRVFSEDRDIKRGLIAVGGIQFTVIAGFILFNTFIPKGSLRFNPDMQYQEVAEEEIEKPVVPSWREHLVAIFRRKSGSEDIDEKFDPTSTNDRRKSVAGRLSALFYWR